MKYFFAFLIGIWILSFTTLAQSDLTAADLIRACKSNNIDKVRESLGNREAINTPDERGFTALFYAMSAENPDIMQLLLNGGADINKLNGYSKGEFSRSSMPILMWAVQMEKKNSVEFLLNNNANVNCRDSNGISLIQMAIESGNLELVKKLADKGANLHKWYKIDDEESGTMLHVAVNSGHINIVKYLLEKGVDIEARTKDGYSALYLAAMMDNLEMVKLLIDHDANIYTDKDYEGTGLMDPDYGGLSTKTRLYLRQVEREKYIRDKKEPGWTQFITTNGYSKYILLKELNDYYQNGGDLKGTDQQGNTILHYLAEGNMQKNKLLSVLVDTEKFDVNAKNVYGQTPLHIACEHDHAENAKFLLDRGADVKARDRDGNTPLNTLARYCYNGTMNREGELAILGMLIEKGADVNAQNAYGRTALSLFAEHAATDKQTQAAQLLIKAGADVNISDNKGSIPLHKAAVRGDISMVKLLLEAGSNINVYNIYSDNPLDVAHFYNAQEQLDLMFSYKKDTCVIEAACFSQIKRLEQIIREGADIEHVHDDFQCQGTALIISAKRNNYNVVQKLLELGAKVNAKDTLGNTALHYAAQYGNDDILRSLLESGADINIRNQKGQKAYDLAVQNNKYRSVQIFKNKFPDIEVAKELPAKEKHIPDKADDSSKISSPAAVKQAVSKEEIKEQMIRQLLEQIQNPFHKAVVQGDLKTVQSMLEKGDVDVNKLDNLFSAPLMYAAYLGNSEILQLLINHGAKVNQTNQQGLTSLHLAAFSGQVDIAKQLLQAGADPSIEAMGGINALEAAMMYEQKEIAQLIQEKYPDLRADIKALPAEIMATEPNDIEADIRRMGDRMKVEEQQWKIKEYTSNTNKPLHMAVIQGNPDIVKKLLENKTLDVNETDRAGMLPLTYTTLLQNKEMAKLLIDHGANVNEIDKNIHAGGGGHTVGAEAGWGVLHYIAMDGDLDMLTFFLENGADVNMVERERGYSPLSIAFRFENEEMIRALAKAGADLKKPDKYGLTLFHQSARFGNMKILKFLLDLGVDIEFKDKGGNTALINACAGGQKDTLLFLLNQGANLNVLDNAGNNALHGAIMDPDSNETIRILIEHGLDVNHRNSQGQPPLFFLARNLVNLREGHFNSAQTMIKAGADLNIRDNNGDTILHLAAKKGAPELVTFLINKGLDVNQTNNQGLTAIQQILNLSCVADNDQKEEVVKILITNGANTNVFDQNGYMPLHDAVRLNLPKVVYFLVKNGADINAQSKNMETPLHVAVGHGYSPVIKVLLEAGARRDILNKYGQKAEDIARNARNEDVLLLFQ